MFKKLRKKKAAAEPGSGRLGQAPGPEPGPAGPLKVGLCIATYKRPQLLARTLKSLAGLSFPQNPGPDLKIIVVENDPDRAGFPAVQKARAELPWPVEYAVEERQGIPFARNRLVAMSRDCDFLAFLDDDEAAEPGWLDELLAVQSQTGAEAVLGPVEPVFEQEPPEWMRSIYYFRRFPDRTQAAFRAFNTQNLLVSARALAEVEGPFDPAFALTGGEDSHLGRSLEARGARFFWADRALVHHFIPRSRTRIMWLLKRRFRFGTGTAIMNRRQFGILGGGARSLLKSIFYLVRGTALLGASVVLGRKALLWGLLYLIQGCALPAGLFGTRYEEYRTIHGK